VQAYRQALVHEDIDRLQSLLADSTLVQTRTLSTLPAFRDQLGETFRHRTVQDLVLQDVTIVDEPPSTSFLEVESSLDPVTLEQQTQVFRTTFELARTEVGSVVRFRIASVSRQGPLVQVTTPGLLVAGPPQAVTLHSPTSAFRLDTVELTAPESGLVQRMTVDGDAASGSFISAAGPHLHRLRVHATSRDGETLNFEHRYRLHQSQEGIAQRVSGTGTTRFFALTVAADGTVWAGGDGGAKLY
jgi:hypothetical protein